MRLPSFILCVASAFAGATPPSPDAAIKRASVAVPAALRGAWAVKTGPIEEPCTPGSEDFKWSFTASAEQFRYWKARGTPTKVQRFARNRFVIDLAMMGEGSEWTERRTFTLSNGGRTLIVDKPVPDLDLLQTQYVRCPPPHDSHTLK